MINGFAAALDCFCLFYCVSCGITIQYMHCTASGFRKHKTGFPGCVLGSSKRLEAGLVTCMRFIAPVPDGVCSGAADNVFCIFC